MFLTIHKIKSRLEKLSSLRYDCEASLFPMEAFDDSRGRDALIGYPPQQGDRFTIAQHDFIVGRDRYFWAEKSIQVPAPRDGFDSILLFDFGYTDPGFTHGFESLLFIDGQPVQGVDTYHNEALLGNRQGECLVQLMFWSGLEGGGVHTEQVMRANTACHCYLHKATESFYYLMSEGVVLYGMLGDDDPVKSWLLSAMNTAILSVDLYAPRAEFYTQVSAALPVFRTALEEIDSCCDVTVSCVGHSHIDLGWLWRVKHTKEKGLRTFSTVLRLMEQYPEYYFLQSQPQLYEFIKEEFPETYQKIRERVCEGRFEINGGMWVEADCNLISGESMVRQFLYGDSFLRQEFGRVSDCLWLPDVFGYSHAMPQILRKCGIKTFMTTKISWNEYNKIPHDTFIWRGIDGSEVLTHFVTTPTTDNTDHYSYFTYNGLLSSDTVRGIWKNYKDKNISRDMLICFGYGDGGGGPTKDMLERMRAIKSLPAMPKVTTSTVSEYFDKLHANIAGTKEYVHTYADELYFENHRGTYTSQAHIKRSNRLCEFALQRAESMIALADRWGGSYDKAQLDKAWKLLLLNQFHDIIPGSSITEVYQDSRIDHASVMKTANALRDSQYSVIIRELTDSYALYNMSGFAWEGLVFIPEQREGSFIDSCGVLSAQRQDDGYLVQVRVRPLGFTNIRFSATAIPAPSVSFTVDGQHIRTPFYDIRWDSAGQIVSLFDLENQRDVVKDYANRLTVFEDISVQFDAWNLDADHLQKFETVDKLTRWEVIACGELELDLLLEWEYRSSRITQTVKLSRNSRRIDFVTTADWHEKQKFLKAMFDVRVFAQKATYDIQFGNVERNNHYSTSWDWAKFEACAHKWIDLSENNYGVAILNDCKYGHSVKDSTLAISLIKCSSWPDTTADEGLHSFTYSLLPHRGSWRQSDVHYQSELLNMPLQVVPGAAPETSLFFLNNPNVAIDTVKPAEQGDGVILRLHEYKGGSESFTIGSDFEILSLEQVNLLERGGVPCGCANTISPYELQTYHIILGERLVNKQE